MEINGNGGKAVRDRVNRKTFGNIGENAARELLESEGYTVLRRNYRCPRGEIDIIAEKDGVASFVEVKTRSSTDYGRPAEAVDYKKRKRIKLAAMAFIDEMSEKNYRFRSYDFQVIEVIIRRTDHAF